MSFRLRCLPKALTSAKCCKRNQNVCCVRAQPFDLNQKEVLFETIFAKYVVGYGKTHYLCTRKQEDNASD